MTQRGALQASGQGSSANPAVQGRAVRDGGKRLRAVFMGTPGFADTILRIVLEAPFIDMQAVYTQPDRPAGRGKQLKAPEVKPTALERGLPVRQPEGFSAGPAGDAAFAELAALKPDVLLVAAYGLILPQRVLDVPSFLPINVHASLLPKYRGAAPIQRAVMNGDAVTGVTVMRMEAGLDSGPILLQRAMGIDINDTSGSLHDELAREGGALLVQALERLRQGTLRTVPQDDALATYAPKLSKSEGFIDLSLSSSALHARIRGVTPRPGARLILRRPGLDDLIVTVQPGLYPPPAEVKALAAASGASVPGRIAGLYKDALLVSCGDGLYPFASLRPAGKGAVSGRAFFNGYAAGHTEAAFAR